MSRALGTSDGDINGDRQIDLADNGSFHGCVRGPDVSAGANCVPADLHIDDHVDLRDAALFQNRFGEQIPCDGQWAEGLP